MIGAILLGAILIPCCVLVFLMSLSVFILSRSQREAEYRRQDKLAKQRLKAQKKRSRSTFV